MWLAIVAAGIWALVCIPGWQVRRVFSEGASARAVFELENEARRTVAQIVLGVFGLSALFVTWRRMLAAEKAVQVAESGQQTERFTKAIEQLGATDDKGNPRLEIRLGGIYALERLARDSEDQDYWTIMEVLTAYVRQNSLWVKEKAGEKEEVPFDDGGEHQREPRIDIQAILTVLGRRSKIESEKQRLDLRGADLRGALLADGNFERAVFNGARLQGASLWKTRLRGAYFLGAQLQNALLQEAQAEETAFSGANLNGTHLELADLSGSDITMDQLRSAHGDSMTKLPKGLSAPEEWPDLA